MRKLKYLAALSFVFSAAALAQVTYKEKAPIYHFTLEPGASVVVDYHLTRHASHQVLACEGSHYQAYGHWTYNEMDYTADLPFALTANGHTHVYPADMMGHVDIKNMGKQVLQLSCYYR